MQGEIESVLAGINIIIETIAPWKVTEDFASASKDYGCFSCGRARRQILKPRNGKRFRAAELCPLFRVYLFRLR